MERGSSRCWWRPSMFLPREAGCSTSLRRRFHNRVFFFCFILSLAFLSLSLSSSLNEPTSCCRSSCSSSRVVVMPWFLCYSTRKTLMTCTIYRFCVLFLINIFLYLGLKVLKIGFGACRGAECVDSWWPPLKEKPSCPRP